MPRARRRPQPDPPLSPADLACIASRGRTDAYGELTEAEQVTFYEKLDQAAKYRLRRAQFAREAIDLRADRRVGA